MIVSSHHLYVMISHHFAIRSDLIELGVSLGDVIESGRVIICFFITNECSLLYEKLELYPKQTTASEPDFYSVKTVIVLQTIVIPL